MQKEIFRTYTGAEILEIPEETYIPIINNILYKNDMVGIIGKYKSNKSVLAMQMACAITSGKPFLDTFTVPEAKNVWFFATEGKDNELKDRFLRMSNMIPVDFDKLVLICSTQLKFNTKMGINTIEKLLERYHDKLPNAIFIDSMYSGFKGTLISDEAMNEFLTRIRFLAEQCNDAACTITHHFNKESKDKDGKVIVQNSTNSYGSVFFMGQADHCFTIERCKKEERERIIKCNSADQRSGNIIEKMRVKFNEPDPLYLELCSMHKEEEEKIKTLLMDNPRGMTNKEIMAKMKIKKSLYYAVINEMETRGKLNKSGKYNGILSLKGES